MRLPFGLKLSRVETRAVHETISSDTLMDLVVNGLKAPSTASTFAGVNVTAESAMGAATVFACVRALANTLSSIPLRLMREGDTGASVPVSDHPVALLLDDPNVHMTRADVIGAAEVWHALAGRAFIEVQRDGFGDPVGLYPIPNPRVDVEIRNGGVIYRVDGVQKPNNQVVHLRGLSFDGVTSIHTCQKVKDAIALALALQENAAMFFGNGSRPSAVLEHPAKLSKEAQERLRDAFEAASSGVNKYRTMVLEEGMKANFQRSENKDSQFLESRDHQDLAICRVFGVPPHKVGIMSGQPRANIEQENLSYVTDIIGPICGRFQLELSRVLLTPEDRAAGLRVKFNLAELLRGDLVTRYKAYALGVQNGWLSPDEVRAAEQMPPIEENKRKFYVNPAAPAKSPGAPAKTNPQEDETNEANRKSDGDPSL